MGKVYADIMWPENQLPEEERQILKDLLKPEHKVIYEIGAWTGNSTTVLAEHAKEVGGHVWTIDTFDGRGSLLEDYSNEFTIKTQLFDNLKSRELLEFVTVLEGSSNDFHSNVKNSSIDFMFIDGDHRYNQFKQDLDNWWPKMKKGGLFTGHDLDVDFIYDENYINMDYKNGHHGIKKGLSEKFDTDKIDIRARIWSITRE